MATDAWKVDRRCTPNFAPNLARANSATPHPGAKRWRSAGHVTKLVSTKICHRRAQKGASSRCIEPRLRTEAAGCRVPGAVKFS